MTWQEKVKMVMKNQDMNQKQLSEKSGIAEASISRYLRGERNVRMDVIVNIAKALGVAVDYLLCEDDSEGCGLSPFEDLTTAIARNGKYLSAEEKNKIISLILKMEED